MEKVIKIGTKILYQVLVIICILVTAIIVFQRISNSNRSIAGYRLFRVITGSMEPEYDVGEVVVCKEIDTRDIKVGDDIVYLGKYGEYNGKIIMHSVVSIETDKDGELNFHAKGLHSSSVEDPQIKESQIYGVVKFKSRILTVLYKLATNIYSLFVIITLLVLNVFISFKGTKKKEIQQLGAVNTTFRNKQISNNKDIYDDEYYEDDEQEDNFNEEEYDEEYDEQEDSLEEENLKQENDEIYKEEGEDN